MVILTCLHRPACAGLVLVLVICLSSHAFAADQAGYNVLLISLDTLRADHMGCYGYKRNTSPNIDKFAKEGVLFENLTAASSWTVPSHMSMFTSLYPSVHGVESTKTCLGDAVPTMAEILSKHGYTTAGFVTGPSLNHSMGFHRGFQFYDDFTVTLMHETNLFHDLDADKSGINQVPTNHVITNLATAWMKKHAREKFFLFVHYWDCHNDYIPPAPYNNKFDPEYEGKENGRGVVGRQKEIEKNVTAEDLAHLVALYDGEIAHTDHHLGKILCALDEMKIKEKTLVIIVSDHGEGFLEHGRLHHGNTLFEEAIHVPLIMRLPGVLPSGLRVKGNASHVDMLPTLLGLLGISKPPDIHGIDLSDACRGKGKVPARAVFSELNLREKMRAIRWGQYKVIQEKGMPAGPLLIVRGGKEHDARKMGVAQKAALKTRRQMAQALRAGPATAGRTDRLARPAKPDEKTLRLLRSLGYME